MTVVAVVPARAGSRGLPGKNRAELSGWTLVQVAALVGLEVAERVVVTTDDAAVAASVADWPVEVWDRPASLAADDAVMADVVSDVGSAAGLGPDDVVLLLQPTSPLRRPEDVRRCREAVLTGGPAAYTVRTLPPSCAKAWVVTGATARPLLGPTAPFANRQRLPEVVTATGECFAFRWSAFLAQGGFPTDAVVPVRTSESSAADVDTEADLAAVRAAWAASDLHDRLADVLARRLGGPTRP